MMRFPVIAALACTLALGACGTASDNPLRATVFANLKQLVSKKGDQQVLTTAILRARLTSEVRASLGASVLIAELPNQKVAAVVLAVAQNGGVTTWQAGDGVAVNTKAGLLLSTRGVGFDLMSSSVDGPLAMIKGRGTGTAVREHRHLDGEDQLVLTRFECTYLHSKDTVLESCANKNLTIENQYWLDRSGDIWRSKQWSGARNGYMLLENPPE
jgi:hypothetical protein